MKSFVAIYWQYLSAFVQFDQHLNDFFSFRERDSTGQIRIPLSDVPQVVRNLSAGQIKWEEDVVTKYPKFEGQEATK